VVIIIVVPAFAGLCLWQVHRALGGNDLSWAYVFEWPFFAGYAIYMWWRLLHEVPQATAGRVAAPARHTPEHSDIPRPASEPHSDSDEADPDEADPDEADRAAYNRYLSELATRGKRKQWR
jgi:hypothetical protein